MLFRLFFWLLRLITPVVTRLTGWRWLLPPVDVPKAVMVIAPHTSNWDFGLMLFYLAPCARWTFWMGKDKLFRGPMNWIMRWLHGIPVNREISSNMVEQVSGVFSGREKVFLAITPEGTRKKKPYWRSGFYYVALQAKVPLLLVYMDYGREQVGSGLTVTPSGDIEADMAIIRQFYSDITGKHPDQAGEVRVAPKSNGQ